MRSRSVRTRFGTVYTIDVVPSGVRRRYYAKKLGDPELLARTGGVSDGIALDDPPVLEPLKRHAGHLH